MRIIRRRYIDIIFIVLAVICGLAAVYLDAQLTYVASANTEWVEIKSLKPGVSQWYIEAADIRISCDGERKEFSGRLRIQSPVIIHIKRISWGPMEISIKSETGSEDQIVAKLHNDETDEDIFAEGCLFITINNLIERAKKGKTIVLAVDGYMEISREVRHETMRSIPVLKSGKVQVVGKTIIGDEIYDAETIILSTGDHFSVDNPGAGKGLIVADQQPGLTAVSFTLGKVAHIRRYGTQGYKVGSSLWVRFENDPVIKALIAAVFFILGALAAWRRWWKESNGKEKSNN